MVSKIKNLTEYEIEGEAKEKPTQQTGDSQKTSVKSDSDIIAKSPLEELRKMRMTKAERERALHMFFFVANLIPSGYHIILFGSAGSGKTTVVLHLCLQILLNHPKTEVFFLYLDGQLGMAANYEVYLEELGLYDRYNILTNLNLEKALSLIEDVVKRKERRPEDLIVVLDTLKYLNPNINNKDSNIKAMQRIKRLTSLGVTFISLHHTNKDGDAFAGTADIEQDGDALLKIVTAPGTEPHTRISTIQEGGRVRFMMEPKTFTFTQGDPTSVEELDEVLEPEKILQLEKDSPAITVIKGVLNMFGEISKTELEEYLKDDDDFDYGEKERKRILREYKNIHWKIRRGGERNNIHNYSALDTTSQTIDRLNEKV